MKVRRYFTYEARQLTGFGPDQSGPDLIKWMADHEVWALAWPKKNQICIMGPHDGVIHLGDWIIRNGFGDFYRVKEEHFQHYEPVEDEN